MSSINELLERYYNAETTAEEEKIIEEYFASGGREGEAADSMLFAAKTAYRQHEPQRIKKRPRTVRLFTIATAVAAMLVLGIFLSNRNHVQTSGPVERDGIASQILIAQPVSGDITDEQQALEQARKALAFVSEQLNKGTSGVGQLNKLESSLSKIKTEQL